MTREEAVNHLMNDWFQALGGQLCVNEDRKDAFLEAIGVAVTALKAKTVKHGVWKLHKNGNGTCSNCKRTSTDVWDFDNFDNYCAHCGAKMDLEET